MLEVLRLYEQHFEQYFNCHNGQQQLLIPTTGATLTVGLEVAYVQSHRRQVLVVVVACLLGRGSRCMENNGWCCKSILLTYSHVSVSFSCHSVYE